MRYRIIARHPENKGPVFFWSTSNDWSTSKRRSKKFENCAYAQECLEFMGVPSAHEIGVDGSYVGVVEKVKD